MTRILCVIDPLKPPPVYSINAPILQLTEQKPRGTLATLPFKCPDFVQGRVSLVEPRGKLYGRAGFGFNPTFLELLSNSANHHHPCYHCLNTETPASFKTPSSLTRGSDDKA